MILSHVITLQDFKKNTAKQLLAIRDIYKTRKKALKLDSPDIEVRMSYKVRKLIPVTVGVLQKLFCTLLTLSSYSMTVQKVISHFNQK